MEKSNGIVVRAVKYGESSLILEILTEYNGLSSFIVSGVRKAKKNTSSLYHPMQQLDIVHYPAKGESLARIKEVKLSVHYHNLLSDVPSTALANFLIECVQKVAKEKDIKSRFYSFLKDSLDYIDANPRGIQNFHLYFITTLTELCGYEIENNYSDSLPYFDIRSGRFGSHEVVFDGYQPTPVGGHLLSTIINEEWDTLQSLTVGKEQRYEYIEMMLLYFQYHVPGFTRPKSIDVFKVVFG